jgi:cell pole-organizing protein PopZ
MNRADQASEPSMEELLASIRLIISDADKKGPVAAKQTVSRRQSSVADGAGEADEVLDLTDDLMLAVPAEMEAAEASAATQASEAEPRPQAFSQKDTKRELASATVSAAPKASDTRSQTSSSGRREPTEAASGMKPLWSRREMPFPGAGFEPNPPRSRAAPQPSKQEAGGWPGDVQMKVPSQGPVSLISGDEKDGASAAWTGEQQTEAGSAALQGDDEAAVAALAQKLARSAAGAMEPEELETAQQVDFERIDETSKSEVTERFADVLARESAIVSKPARPNLLNEVFRQDYRLDGAAQSSAAPAQPSPIAPSAQEWDAAFEVRPTENERLSQVTAPAHRDRFASAPQHDGERVSPAFAVPAAAQALVPAQQSLTAQPVRSLEDAVREMLRPLLVQWLNEHMPRILENAIREEIAARGIFPNKDV